MSIYDVIYELERHRNPNEIVYDCYIMAFKPNKLFKKCSKIVKLIRLIYFNFMILKRNHQTRFFNQLTLEAMLNIMHWAHCLRTICRILR